MRERAGGGVDEEEPGAEGVGDVVQTVGVGDAVDSRVEGEGEDESVGEEADAVAESALAKNLNNMGRFWGVLRKNLPARDPWQHITRAHRLNQQGIGQDGHKVMVRRKRSEPADGKIVYPDDEHGHVDGQDPKHEDEHGVCVIVEVGALAAAAIVAGQTQAAHRGDELHHAEDDVGELVGDKGRDE